MVVDRAFSTIENELMRNKSDKAITEQMTEKYKVAFADEIKGDMGKLLMSSFDEGFSSPLKRKKPFKVRFEEKLKEIRRNLKILFFGDNDGFEQID